MPQIPQIGDSTGKSYSTTLNNNRGSSSGGDQQFTVDGSQRPEQLQVVSDKNAGNNAQTTMGQKDLIPLAVTVSKSQALAVETIKDIINADLLSTAKLNGYTELAGELESLSGSLYIPASRLLDEILEQENQNTMFINDRFYDLLREAAADASPDLKEAIGNMLKAINFSQNRDEITSALSSNLKFLAEYFSPNRVLSEELSALAERWSSGEPSQNFTTLRNETSALLKNVSESLLNDSHTQTLLPIVIHNISKYNTNDTMLREYFGQLLTQIPSYEMRSELSRAFEALLAKLLNGAEGRADEGSYQDPTAYRFSRADEPSAYPSGAADTPTRETDVADSSYRLAGDPSGSTDEAEAGARAGSGEVPIAQNEDARNTPFTNYTINGEKNQVENSFFDKEITNFSKESENFRIFSEYMNENLTDEAYLSETGLDAPDFSDYITALYSGSQDAKTIVTALLTGLIEDEGLQSVIAAQMDRVGSIEELVVFLNNFLDAMPEGPLRDSVYEALDEALAALAETEALPESSDAPETAQATGGTIPSQNMNERAYPGEGAPPRDIFTDPRGETAQAAQKSSIRALTDFVARNINHPALKSVDSFNASNLLQSMINAPGVMTPLSHFILPIRVEDTRAFGELWVDNDNESSEKSEGGEKRFHMFLTFDVDAFGRFEVDVYAGDTSMNVSLLHPPSFGRNIDRMIEKIHRVAAGAGYTINRFETGVLKKPHNLTQIFPKLIERRSGLNVQA
ncbi:MAG: hypothetical protein NC084_12715 [Bacteroides sp.]|nr:hypothetical protein [Roseburia sp.]MCM1463556.1 hypothetical protein [Bacteroides sp.]